MWRKGLIKKRKQLLIIGNERRSDKLDECMKVYKWYPLVWEPGPSRSGTSPRLV